MTTERAKGFSRRRIAAGSVFAAFRRTDRRNLPSLLSTDCYCTVQDEFCQVGVSIWTTSDSICTKVPVTFRGCSSPGACRLLDIEDCAYASAHASAHAAHTCARGVRMTPYYQIHNPIYAHANACAHRAQGSVQSYAQVKVCVRGTRPARARENTV